MHRTLYVIFALVLALATGCSEQPTAPQATADIPQTDRETPGDILDGQNLDNADAHPDKRCPHGYFEGHWVQDSANVNQGYFLAKWTDRNGMAIGILSGRFWQTDHREGAFEGNVSGVVTDQIIAYVRGRWYYDDARLCPVCGQGHGVMHGRVKFLNSDRHGVMRGEFGDYELSPFERTLPLKGAWTLRCRNFSSIDVSNPAE
jgi:hypothetical protein